MKNILPIANSSISLIRNHIVYTEWYQKTAWKKTFVRCSHKTSDFTKEKAIFLAEKKSIFRFFSNTFKTDTKKYPYPKDFAVAIAFELKESNINLSPKSVIKFSSILWKEWHEFIANNSLLRESYKKHRGVYPSEFINSLRKEDKYYDDSLEVILNDSMLVRREFFESYSEPGGTDIIRIYLKNKENYVSHKPEDSVSIHLYSIQAVDSGFYRVGYDYKSGESWLQAAYYNKKTKSETGIFSGDSKNCISDNWNELCWLK